MKRILVLDVGTSALKAVLFDSAGAVIGNAEAEYGAQPAPHRQRVDDWWKAAREAITSLGPLRPDAIALSGTMENLIAVDREGQAAFDAILYSDPCGTDALDRVRIKLGEIGAAAILGNAPEPLMTVFKIAWLAETHPSAFEQAAYFLPGAKDALTLRLTGQAVTDPVTATTTGLMDITTRDWHPALLRQFGVERGKLPRILPAGAVVGVVSDEAAKHLGFEPGPAVPVVNGCGDGGATTLGSSCESEGDISLYLGSTGWLARVVAAEKLGEDAPVYRLAHPKEGLIVEITPILSAGASGNWARGLLGISTDERDRLLAAADRKPKDLVFLPYLLGERFPFLDTEVRGAFLGLDAGHDRADLYYAVLEGVSFAIRANLEAIDPGAAGRVRLAGGGATSRIWPQMLADILDRPVDVPKSAELATARGAFLVAAETLGLSSAIQRAAQFIVPRSDRMDRTKRLRRAFAAATAIARDLVGRRPKI